MTENDVEESLTQLRGRGQQQDEQKRSGVLAAKNLAQDSSHWKKS